MFKSIFTRKILLVIAVVFIVILCAIFFLIYNNTGSENTNIIAPTPIKPTSVRSLDKKNKPIRLPISEDDPRLWLDENGNPIKEVE